MARRASGRLSGKAALVPAAVATVAFLGGFVGGRALAEDDPIATFVEQRAPDLSRFDAPIAAAAAEFAIDPYLLKGLVGAESSGRPNVVSGAGAVGLVQLMPDTAKEQAAALGIDLSKTPLTDPEVNLRVGARYLAKLLRELDGKPEFALAAYNAGKAHVLRWRIRAVDASPADVIHREAFGETRHHVRRALAYAAEYRAQAGAR